MEREQEIKRSVNKAIEKHQGKKVKAKVEPKEDAKVRQLNFRRWAAVLGPVAAAMLVGAYLYVTPGSFNTVKEQVSGIFINHSQDTLESPTYSDIASNEAGLGFQEPEGPRLNGEYGPEDDVLTEEQISEEAIDPATEANETVTATEETAPAEAIIEEKSKPALVDLPQNSEEISSTDVAEDKSESPVKENSKKVHYNFSAKGKPLYNVKKRPEDLATSNTPNYKPKTEKQPKTVAAQPKIASESEMAPAKAIVAQNKSEQNKVQKTTEQKVNPNTSAQANLANAGEFQIIVGAFSSAANANNYVEQLKGQGWSAYSYRAGNLNRVAIGKLKNRDQANSLLGQVKQQVNSRAWVNQL